MITDIISQGFGILGASLNIISYQAKSTKMLIFCQFLGSSFFLFNYLMLGAYTGCFMNGMAVLRALIFLGGAKTRKIPVLILLNVLLIGGTYFTWEGFLSLFPLIAMIAITFAMYFGSGKLIRMTQLFAASPLWLVYNACCGTIGGTVCEVFMIVSTAVSFIRFGFNGFKK